MGRRRRRAVEECLALGVRELLAHAAEHGRVLPSPLRLFGIRGRLARLLAPVVGTTVGGTFSWPDGPAIGYELTRSESGAEVRLSYTLGGRDAEPTIRLEAIAAGAGPARELFACPGGPTPHAAWGAPCGRRVATLYARPGRLGFACRHCHGLTYLSRRRHYPRIP
jgi:hypothetical protein